MAAARRTKILLVDDTRTALAWEQSLLASGAYDLIIARDGEEAVEKTIREHPDLILMDVEMPGMDGYTACQRIRATEGIRSIPIILVTVHGEAERIAAGKISGCNDYLVKPVKAADLRAMLRKYLAE